MNKSITSFQILSQGMQSEIALATFDDLSSCVVDMDYERVLAHLESTTSSRIVGQEWIQSLEKTATAQSNRAQPSLI